MIIEGAFEAPTAIGVATTSFEWYARNVRRARGRYQTSEVVLLIVAAAVPIAGTSRRAIPAWPRYWELSWSR